MGAANALQVCTHADVAKGLNICLRFLYINTYYMGAANTLISVMLLLCRRSQGSTSLFDTISTAIPTL